jgi:hypothetical protein
MSRESRVSAPSLLRQTKGALEKLTIGKSETAKVVRRLSLKVSLRAVTSELVQVSNFKRGDLPHASAARRTEVVLPS